jgi:ribosome-binding factor A
MLIYSGIPQEALNIIWSAVGIIVTGLISWATAGLVAFLNSKIKDAKVKQWATDLTNIIMSSVMTIAQTYVDSLKQQGAFTEEKQKEAFNKCLALIKEQLTPELKKYIEDNFGDMEAYLKSQIESMIKSMK